MTISIHYFKQIPYIISVAIFLAVAIVYYCFELGARLFNRVMENERDFVGQLLLGSSEYERKFAKSCHPFTVKIGSFFTIDKTTMIDIGDVINGNVVDLLLFMRESE